ncbi:MAG: hypothetical protein AAGI51_01375 [Pseudomonadota bacterium]
MNRVIADLFSTFLNVLHVGVAAMILIAGVLWQGPPGSAGDIGPAERAIGILLALILYVIAFGTMATFVILRETVAKMSSDIEGLRNDLRAQERRLTLAGHARDEDPPLMRRPDGRE